MSDATLKPGTPVWLECVQSPGRSRAAVVVKVGRKYAELDTGARVFLAHYPWLIDGSRDVDLPDGCTWFAWAGETMERAREAHGRGLFVRASARRLGDRVAEIKNYDVLRRVESVLNGDVP